jgi:hypothetical protein
VIATLRALGALDDSQAEALGQFTRTDVYNVAGRTVGHIEARLPDTIPTVRT